MARAKAEESKPEAANDEVKVEETAVAMPVSANEHLMNVSAILRKYRNTDLDRLRGQIRRLKSQANK